MKQLLIPRTQISSDIFIKILQPLLLIKKSINKSLIFYLFLFLLAPVASGTTCLYGHKDTSFKKKCPLCQNDHQKIAPLVEKLRNNNNNNLSVVQSMERSEKIEKIIEKLINFSSAITDFVTIQPLQINLDFSQIYATLI